MNERLTAVIRRTPEEFVVEELPAYAASGQGEHLFVTFTKRGLTTLDAVAHIARALEVNPRDAGFAGMKDRHAVTTQTASFPFPMARDAEAAAARVAVPGVTILAAARHVNKLRLGHLVGNRFTITLAELPTDAVDGVREHLALIGREGVPNAYGAQRFGRDGDNPARALAWIAGKDRGPRGHREQQILASALQSLLFNRVLQRREDAGTWARVLPGDLAKKHDTGGLFPVPIEGPELDAARARAEAGSVSATGPMFGAKMRWPEGEPGVMERDVLAAADLAPDTVRRLGEGTRRPLRLFVAEMASEARVESTGRAVVVVRFVLPKGGYATTVLGRVCRIIDTARAAPRGAADQAEPQDTPEPPEET